MALAVQEERYWPPVGLMVRHILVLKVVSQDSNVLLLDRDKFFLIQIIIIE